MEIFSREMNVMMRKMKAFILGRKKIRDIFLTDLMRRLEKDFLKERRILVGGMQ